MIVFSYVVGLKYQTKCHTVVCIEQNVFVIPWVVQLRLSPARLQRLRQGGIQSHIMVEYDLGSASECAGRVCTYENPCCRSP